MAPVDPGMGKKRPPVVGQQVPGTNHIEIETAAKIITDFLRAGRRSALPSIKRGNRKFVAAERVLKLDQLNDRERVLVMQIVSANTRLPIRDFDHIMKLARSRAKRRAFEYEVYQKSSIKMKVRRSDGLKKIKGVRMFRLK